MLRKITHIFDYDDDSTEDEDTGDAPIGNISHLFLRRVKAPGENDVSWGIRMT